MVKTYKKGSNIQLSKNFNTHEFDCHCGKCQETLIDTDLVGILQMIRAHFDKPIVINSGYRCPTHNANVGGASRSRHKLGMAADIRINGINPAEIAKYAESIDVKGIGLYNWGCHIDTRNVKSFWKGKSQERVNTFGGKPNKKIDIQEWQLAAIADGFDFNKYGADGKWGKECEEIARKAICKRRTFYKYRNLTKLVQKVVNVTADGKFGKNTKEAVKDWQFKEGLKPDGIVGLNSWRKMIL